MLSVVHRADGDAACSRWCSVLTVMKRAHGDAAFSTPCDVQFLCRYPWHKSRNDARKLHGSREAGGKCTEEYGGWREVYWGVGRAEGSVQDPC